MDKLTPVQRHALEAARHELVTTSGLLAADGMAPQETFPLDFSQTIELLDAVLDADDATRAISDTDSQPS